jgi:hypothetical protein
VRQVYSTKCMYFRWLVTVRNIAVDFAFTRQSSTLRLARIVVLVIAGGNTIELLFYMFIRRYGISILIASLLPCGGGLEQWFSTGVRPRPGKLFLL